MVEEIDFKEIPEKIREFYYTVFELQDVLGYNVWFKNIRFSVYTRDHNPPHVHVKYDKYEISISLIDFSVLSGNLPKKNRNIAIKWIKENRDYLLEYWNDKVIVSSLPMVVSNLDSDRK